MRIDAIEAFGRDELLAALKRTRLEGFGRPEIYADARLELVEGADPDALAPAQNYLLKPQLENVRALRVALAERGIDLFALDGGLWLTTPGERIPVIPPIVEESHERDGRTVRIVSDGMHRVWVARSLGVPINVVEVHGVPREYPYYAHARAEGWAGIDEIDELVYPYTKKDYRMPEDRRALFRRYNDVYPGVQKTRTDTNPVNLPS